MTDSRSGSATDRRATTHELGLGTKGPSVGGHAKSMQNTQLTGAIDA
jgi:hypothetical protein